MYAFSTLVHQTWKSECEFLNQQHPSKLSYPLCLCKAQHLLIPNLFFKIFQILVLCQRPLAVHKKEHKNLQRGPTTHPLNQFQTVGHPYHIHPIFCCANHRSVMTKKLSVPPFHMTPFPLFFKVREILWYPWPSFALSIQKKNKP